MARHLQLTFLGPTFGSQVKVNVFNTIDNLIKGSSTIRDKVGNNRRLGTKERERERERGLRHRYFLPIVCFPCLGRRVQLGCWFHVGPRRDICMYKPRPEATRRMSVIRYGTPSVIFATELPCFCVNVL